MQKGAYISAFMVHEHPNTCIVQPKDIQREVLALMQNLLLACDLCAVYRKKERLKSSEHTW